MLVSSNLFPKQTILKLSLMYKVWNGLALRHLKVRLTNAMVKLRIQRTWA